MLNQLQFDDNLLRILSNDNDWWNQRVKHRHQSKERKSLVNVKRTNRCSSSSHWTSVRSIGQTSRQKRCHSLHQYLILMLDVFQQCRWRYPNRMLELLFRQMLNNVLETNSNRFHLIRIQEDKEFSIEFEHFSNSLLFFDEKVGLVLEEDIPILTFAFHNLMKTTTATMKKSTNNKDNSAKFQQHLNKMGKEKISLIFWNLLDGTSKSFVNLFRQSSNDMNNVRFDAQNSTIDRFDSANTSKILPFFECFFHLSLCSLLWST